MGSIANQQGTLIVGNGGSSDNILTLNDNGSSVLTLTDGGSLGIGTTSPSQKLDVVGTAGFGATTIGGNITISDNVMPSANATYDIGTVAASLRAAYATNYILVSDNRLKQNIQPVENALEQILSLEPVQYHFKTQPEQKRLGLIAQDVEAKIPQVVKTGGDTKRTKALRYHELTSLLLAAEKERGDKIRKQYKQLQEKLEAIEIERERLLKIIEDKENRTAGGQR